MNIVLAADPKLNRTRMQWMMQEVNKLIWVSSAQFGIMQQQQWDHAVKLLLDSKILKVAPARTAFRTDLMKKAFVP